MDEGWQDAVASDQLASGEMVGLEFGDQQIAVYRTGDSYFATDNVCSHAFAILTEGFFDGEVVECPLHGGQFDVRTGEPVMEPAECSIKTFRTRVVGGMVQILLETPMTE